MAFKPSRPARPKTSPRPPAEKPAKTGAAKSAPKSADSPKPSPRPPAEKPAKFGAKKSAAKPADAPKTSSRPVAEKPAKLGVKKSATKPTDAPKAPAMQPKKYINVYLSLGSNVGNRRANIEAAAAFIHKEIGKIARRSHLYETQPWGKTDQELFLNQVLMINTLFEPRRILEKISLLEQEMGRERSEKWGPRTLDVDILFYGRRVIRDRGLDIPHPELHKRAFVLVPLLEIAPDLEHPILKMPIDELYAECRDQSEVVMLD